MEATACIEKIRRIEKNRFVVTFSVSITSFHLKLLDKRGENKAHSDKASYTFALTVLERKFHMAPEDTLGECMEIHDNHETLKGLTPYQQRQWCIGALTHRIVNHLLSTEILNPFFLVDIPMTPGDDDMDVDNGEDNISPIGVLKEKLRDIEGSIEGLIDLIDGMRAVSSIEGKAIAF